MAKTKISEFSATPGNNTDIDGINIAEGCAPSGINDAIRELMSQLKDFQTGAAGDSFNGPVGTTTAAAGAFTTLSASSTVSGTGFSTYLASPPAIGGTAAAAGSFTTLSASSTVTLSGGTANGVLYLNGSKVATSGSALTFDGTNLSLTTANAIYKVPNAGGSLFDAGGNNGFYIQGTPTAYLGFYAGGNEQMRLTSTGLGIGTSSPSAKLTITGTGATGYTSLLANGTTTAYNLWRLSNTGGDLRIGIESSTAVGILTGSTNYSSCIGTLTATNLHLGTNSTVQATIDSSGNLGLGVTPSAWNSTYRVLNIGEAGLLSSRVNASIQAIDLGVNWYRDAGGSYLYAANGYGTNYVQQDGVHSWYYAASGTAGNAISFTQAMRLSAAGNLGIGETNPSAKLHLGGNTASAYQAILATGVDDSSFHVVVQNGVSGTSAVQGYIGLDYASGTWPRLAGIQFIRESTSGALAFTTGTTTTATERARIDSSGNLLVGTTSVLNNGKFSVYQTNNSFGAVVQNTSSAVSGAYGIQANLTQDPNTTDSFFYKGTGNATDRFYVRANGGIGNYQANDVNLSDRREKTNFSPAKSYLDVVCAIPVQTFKYIDQTDDELTLGVVAQDVQAVAPELVHESNWGSKDDPKMRLSIYQTDLQYALMKCIQELKAEVDSLKAQLKGN